MSSSVCVLSATAPPAFSFEMVRSPHMPPPPVPTHRDSSASGKRVQQQTARPGATTPLSPSQLSVPNSPSAASAYPFPPESPKGQLWASTHLREPLRSTSRATSNPTPPPNAFARPSNTISSLRAGSPAPSYTNLSSITASSSRASSRRPSTANFQSFLEGVTHATRVRSPSLRGHSRRSSFTTDGPPLFTPDGSTAGLSRRPSYSNLYDHEDDFVIDDIEDEQPPVFEEGERLAVGARHLGYLVQPAMPKGNQARTTTATVENLKLEVGRKVGSGSYAVVYLAREVLYDPVDDELLDADDYLDTKQPQQVTYGREFALKCLCKHNLDEELLQVQRFEVELHASLPAHPNIVSLHAAFETPLWLFLVMEYCPGQDLFYWLEQHRDQNDMMSAEMHPSASFESQHDTLSRTVSESLYASTPRPNMSLPPPPLPASDSTPPSPSILSKTANSSLLGRRRLRLISRMFEQMCEAVATCHSVGVSHRDIKPENFICSTDEVDNASMSHSERRVIVKLTDWGLGSNEVECGDFDCGSKPYMAYECRNNLGPSYRPREADIWSLGIVLLNLLFHRCPWADPSPDDPDFALFRRDRVTFLERRFEGIGREVATFLAERVFADDAARRVTARDFGKWATKLNRYMGGATASVSDAALPIQPTTARPSLAPSSRRLSLSSSRSESRPSPRTSLAAAQQLQQQLNGHTTMAAWTNEIPDDLKAALDLDFCESINSSTPVPDHTASTTPVPPPLTLTMTMTEPSPPPSEPAAEGDNEAGSPVALEVPPSTDADVAALVGARQRRRKRGARKPRPLNIEEPNGGTTSDPDPVAPASAPATERDTFLNDLAEASEHLARQLSKRPPPSSLAATNGSHSTSSVPTVAKKPSSGLMSKVRATLTNGNPQLEAFRQQAYERDVSLGRTSGSHVAAQQINSAPARLGTGSGTSSMGSRSSASSWSADGGMDGRSHWASTTDRRSRLAHHHSHQPHAGGTTPSTSSSASPTRRTSSSLSGTPLSSMSSVYSAIDEAPPVSRKSATPSLDAIAEARRAAKTTATEQRPGTASSNTSTETKTAPTTGKLGKLFRTFAS